MIVPAGVVSIGWLAFADCPALESVTFEGRTLDEVKKMENYPWGIQDLSVIQPGALLSEQARLDETAPTPEELAERRRAEAEVEAATRGLTRVGKDDLPAEALKLVRRLALADGVEEIWDGAFDKYACPELESVRFPASLREIGWGAFLGAGIRELDLPEGLEEIDGWAFSCCHELRRVTAPGRLAEIGAAAYSECESLLNVQIGGCRKIFRFAFKNCKSLSEIELPDDLAYIGSEAFRGCASLREIVVPTSIEEIGMGAFDECPALEFVTFEGRSLGEVRAMKNYPWGLPRPDEQIVAGELLAENAEMSAEEANAAARQALESGDSFLQWNVRRSMTEVDVPDGVKSVTYSTFLSARRLRRVSLPPSCAYIGREAFELCTSLEEIDLGGARMIQDRAFQNCSSLRELSLPDGLQTIGAYAFYRCSGLAWVAVPRSVFRIGQRAFAGCASMESVVFEGRTAAEIGAMPGYPWGLSAKASRVFKPGVELDEAAGLAAMCRRLA